MAKMYYTEAEAAEKLGVSPEQLLNLAREGKLQVYADGPNKMYKVAEVDDLAGIDTKAESDIVLTPADTTGDAISLADDESDQDETPGKGDTVITSEGISIFDDEDVELETADPMAKTQIAPSIEDQITLEGVGSGSGLLDLTRESDDTSLGAEVLDHIDVEGEPSAEGPATEVATGYQAPEPVVETQASVEAADPTGGAFSGMLVVGTILMVLLVGAAMGVIFNTRPSWVASLGANALFLLLGAVVVGGVATVVGLVLGKSSARA